MSHSKLSQYIAAGENISLQKFAQVFVGPSPLKRRRPLNNNFDEIPEEDGIRDFAFATIVATKNIQKGEYLSKSNTWPKRPGIGEILACDHELIIGKKVNKDIQKDFHISLKDID